MFKDGLHTISRQEVQTEDFVFKRKTLGRQRGGVVLNAIIFQAVQLIFLIDITGTVGA